MTELEIIKYLAKWVDQVKYPFQIPNAFIYGWECDYWALDSRGIAREFEIKVSRSDYFNDCKKDKHKAANGANYFYYVCPKDLIKKDEVDPKYGLIYVWDSGFVQIVKKPRLLHSNLFDGWQMLANKMYHPFRNLWRDKYIAEEITHEQYLAGFNIELEQEEKTES